MRQRILVVLVVVAVVVGGFVILRGGGGGGSSDAVQVRATLAAYTQASAAQDYAGICRRFLAPRLLDKLRQIRIPCRTALKRGLGSVHMPTLLVNGVKVTGTTALAQVVAGAANQKPLAGTIELIKVDGLWRVLSLAEQQQKTPAP